MLRRQHIARLGILPAVILWLLISGSVIQSKDKPSVIPASASDSKSADLTFAQSGTDTLTIDYKQLKEKGLDLLVASSTAGDHDVQGNAGDFGFRDAKGNTVDSAKILKVELIRNVTKLTGDLRVRLSVIDTATELMSGTYGGYITLTEKGAAQPIRKYIKITVSDTRLDPLVDKVTFTAYRFFPGLSFSCSGCFIPLRSKFNTDTFSLKENTQLAGLRRDEGGTATLSWDGQRTPLMDPPRIGLTAYDIEYAGKYEGQLKTNPGDEKAASVNLTVNAKDIILWPILVIAGSIWLALKLKQYVNVRRTAWRLREEEAALGVKFKGSQQSFKEAAQNQPYASYSIATNLKKERELVITNIDKLQTKMNLDPNDVDYKKIIDTLSKLEAKIDAWGTFADQLAGLQSVLENARGEFGDAPPGSPGLVPLFYDGAKELLAGEEITLDKFNDLMEQVSYTTAFVQVWTDLRERVQAAVTMLPALEALKARMNDEQQQKLVDAHEKISEAWAELWTVKGAADLDKLTTGAGLDAAEQEINQLSYLLNLPGKLEPTLNPADHKLTLKKDSKFLSLSFTHARDFMDALTDDGVRERYYASALKRWDGLIACLAFVVAVLTGLDKYYLGKPFGTWHDYIAIILWGLGTKAALDLITGTLEKVAGSVLPNLISKTQ